jgi:hypothetical protein
MGHLRAFYRLKVLKGFAITFVSLAYCVPAYSCLRSLKIQHFKKVPVIMNEHPPFKGVVSDIPAYRQEASYSGFY